MHLMEEGMLSLMGGKEDGTKPESRDRRSFCEPVAQKVLPGLTAGCDMISGASSLLKFSAPAPPAGKLSSNPFPSYGYRILEPFWRSARLNGIENVLKRKS